MIGQTLILITHSFKIALISFKVTPPIARLINKPITHDPLSLLPVFGWNKPTILFAKHKDYDGHKVHAKSDDNLIALQECDRSDSISKVPFPPKLSACMLLVFIVVGYALMRSRKKMKKMDDPKLHDSGLSRLLSFLVVFKIHPGSSQKVSKLDDSTLSKIIASKISIDKQAWAVAFFFTYNLLNLALIVIDKLGTLDGSVPETLQVISVCGVIGVFICILSYAFLMDAYKNSEWNAEKLPTMVFLGLRFLEIVKYTFLFIYHLLNALPLFALKKNLTLLGLMGLVNFPGRASHLPDHAID